MEYFLCVILCIPNEDYPVSLPPLLSEKKEGGLNMMDDSCILVRAYLYLV
jgi:hypothetical protein